MANFQLQHRNIHDSTQSATVNVGFSFELWGPLYEKVPNSKNFDQELSVEVVKVVPSNLVVSLTRGQLSKDKRVRGYQVRSSQPGQIEIRAKDHLNRTWSQFKVDVKSAATAAAVAGGRRRYTKAQMTTPSGQMGWPGWKGACPAIQALVSGLEAATSGALSRTNGKLQGSGHGKYFYEHYAGLALDIFLNSAHDTQKQQAHNLIRFLVKNRQQIKFRNMFYQNFGFSQSGSQGGSPDHGNHIHIDWFDVSLAEPPRYVSPRDWIAISWPESASADTFLKSSEGQSGLAEAWKSSVGPFAASDIAKLYA